MKAHLSLSSRAVPPVRFTPHSASMNLALPVMTAPPEVPRTAGEEGFTGWTALGRSERICERKRGRWNCLQTSISSSMAYPLGSNLSEASFSSVVGYAWEQAVTSPTAAIISPSQNSPGLPILTWASHQMSTKNMVIWG